MQLFIISMACGANFQIMIGARCIASYIRLHRLIAIKFFSCTSIIMPLEAFHSNQSSLHTVNISRPIMTLEVIY